MTIRAQRTPLTGLPRVPDEPELLATHGPAVYALCRRLADTPDDAYQAIWEKVFRALPRFDPDGSAALSTWIHTIAHNHLVDLHRSRARRGQVVSLDAAPAVDPDLDARLQHAHRRRRLADALDRLPDPQRRAVMLHYLDEVPLRTIAAHEGVPIGTVKSRLHSGRAHLIALLGAES